MRRRTPTAFAAVALLAGCTGGSSGAAPSTGPSRPAVTVTPTTSAYQQDALRDGASLYAPGAGTGDLHPGDALTDLAGQGRAKVVGGTVTRTSGPDGPALQFTRSGRVVTSVTSGLASSNAFTLEVDLRPDLCVSAWGRVLGTTTFTEQGREGVELLHFPKQFAQSPCTFGVEFWHRGDYLGGCYPRTRPPQGVWQRWALTYDGGVARCYLDGRPFGTVDVAPKAFGQLAPLGIGGSGSGYQGPLDGASIGDVALYRRALTAAEVLRHSAPAPAPAPSSP